jgi:hypothetical protein
MWLPLLAAARATRQAQRDIDCAVVKCKLWPWSVVLLLPAAAAAVESTRVCVCVSVLPAAVEPSVRRFGLA